MTDEEDDLRSTQEFVVEETIDLDKSEALDDAAQGQNLTAEDATTDADEIDAMGRAAGIPPADGKPFAGIAAVEGRDAHRWELDPRSAEDAASRR